MRPSLLRTGSAGVLSLLIAGCTAYSSARASLPPDPQERIALRIYSAQIAVRDLDQQLRVPTPDPAALESYVWELSRRVASVQDLAPQSTGVQEALALLDEATLWATQAQQAAAEGDENSTKVLCAHAHASLMKACARTDIELARLAEQPGTTEDATHRLTTRAGTFSTP